jgi:hypothetical protein
VFAIALDAASDALMRLPRAADDPRIGEAAALLEQWRALSAGCSTRTPGCARRGGRPARPRLFLRVLGDASSPFPGRRPAGRGAGHGRPVRGGGAHGSRAAARRAPPEREQRRGKLIGVVVDDLGIWDTWSRQPALRRRRADPEPPASSRATTHRRDADGKLLELTAVARSTLTCSSTACGQSPRTRHRARPAGGARRRWPGARLRAQLGRADRAARTTGRRRIVAHDRGRVPGHRSSAYSGPTRSATRSGGIRTPAPSIVRPTRSS